MLNKSILLLVVVVLYSCNQRPKRNSAFYVNLGGEPARMNPIATSDVPARKVRDYMHESLADLDIETYEFTPMLATKWEISKDKKEFTFHLRKNAFWWDGKPVTAEDVKYSFDIIFDDKFNNIKYRSYYEGIKEVQIIDEKTVKFITKTPFYMNFDIAAYNLKIFPKHFYNQDKKKSFFNRNYMGSGPYKMGLYSRGNRIVLERNDKWWGFNDPNQKKWNFEKIVLRFVSDGNVQLQMLKKGSLDMMAMRSDVYKKKAVGPEWGKSVHKLKVYNKYPKGYNFIGWNMKHPILKDLEVRKALYHLVNRKLMIEKFEYNMSKPALGPIYPESGYAANTATPVPFNPKKALKLLRKAGWADTDGDSILDKVINGKKRKLSITILEPASAFMKYLTIFKEDAKQAGVEINIKLIEWNSFIKLIEERKFDAVRLAWSASIDWDPTQIWHTKSIKGGSNFIGFSNPEVDKLSEEARLIHDRDKRIKVLRKAEKIIIDQYPYVWFSYKASSMYGVTDRIKREKDTYQFDVGKKYWSFKSKMREDK